MKILLLYILYRIEYFHYYYRCDKQLLDNNHIDSFSLTNTSPALPCSFRSYPLFA